MTLRMEIEKEFPMKYEITKFDHKGFKIRLGAIRKSRGCQPVADIPVYSRGETRINRIGTRFLGFRDVGSVKWAIRDARRLARAWVDKHPSIMPDKTMDFPPPIPELGD